MVEGQLEAIRRQIHEAEERLKKSSAEHGNARPPLAEMKDHELAPTPPPPSATPPDQKPNKLREELTAVHRRFRALLENSGDAFILVDSKGDWELANQNLSDWLGYTLEELQGISLTEVFEREDVKELLAGLPQWLGGESPVRRAPYTLKGKHGEQVPVLLSSHSWISEAGEQVAWLVLEDMRYLHNLEAQVAGMKGFIDAVMRSGTVPVFLLRKDGLIMEANRAGCQRLVVEQEQLLNLHLQDFVVGSARTDFQALLGRATAQQLVSGTYRFLRARGKEFVASVSLVGVADAKGTVSRILVTMERLRIDDSVPEAEGRV